MLHDKVDDALTDTLTDSFCASCDLAQASTELPKLDTQTWIRFELIR